MNHSAAESLLAFQLRVSGIEHEREYGFEPCRRWRADFRIACEGPRGDLLVEVEGGAWTGGRHVRGAGFENDCEKYAAAMLRGYRVLRVTPGMVDDGRALDWIMRLREAQTSNDERVSSAGDRLSASAKMP